MSADRAQRSLILENLQRQLRTIKAADGYSRDIYDASFDVKTWDQLPEAETPMVYIIDQRTQYQYHPGRLVEVTWDINLFGIMKNASQMEMEDFIADIDICLTKNALLSFPETGQVVSHIRIRDIVTDNQLFSQVDNSQLFKITISLIYTKCYGQR